MPAAIEVHGLRMSYGDLEAVRGIDFEVERGEIFGVLGTNGAGKTTTIEILEGYRKRTGGDVSVLGVDPGRPTREWRNQVGFVLQESRMDPLYTVRETVGMFAGLFDRPRGVDETIDLVGLAEKRDARIGTLSGGQQRRVDVALALIGDPDLVFLDEPTTGFDPSARRDAWSMIEGLKVLGKTVLLTTHYMDEAQSLSDRVAILRAGQVVAHGRPEDLTGGGGGHVSIIRFRLPPGVTAERVAAEAGVPAESTGGLVALRADDPQPTLLRLLSWADRERVELSGLDVRRPSLEDVFLELTRGAAEDG
jgi:ABC-2 type transport system ATP-binding protein